MSNRKLVLTVLGGGSYYTPSFIGTMVGRPEIWTDCEVRLHDPDAERVALVKAFCEAYTARKGVPMTFVARPDLDAALDGADFVITAYRIGGLDALARDVAIPPKFGYLGDETAGPGGMFMAIRTVPVVVDAARRMERLCPDAWLLNYANPSHYVVAGVTRTTKVKAVGLCDNYIAAMNDVGFLAGVDEPRKIAVRYTGYNHCNWVYAAEYEGRDLLAELAETADDQLYKRIAELRERWRLNLECAVPLFRLTGWFPAATSHAVPYFYHSEFLERQLASTSDGVARRREQMAGKWDALKSQLDDYRDEIADKVVRTQHGGAHADLAIGVASALAGGGEALYPVNIPHGGAVDGFAPEAVIELYAAINADGATPVGDIPRFPPVLYHHQQQLYAYMELVIDGILQKNKARFAEALLIHPFTSSAHKAAELLEAMWEQNRR